MSGSEQRTERQSNFELIRIVAMAFIVVYHVVRHGQWDNGGLFFPEELTFNAVMLQGMLPLGKIGVNLFILISGYFLISSERCTWPKAVRLWTQMLFYSVLIFLIFACFDGLELTPRRIAEMLMPFLSFTWWFASTYLLMLLLSPFVNMALNSISESSHLKLIIGSLIVWSVVPMITGISPAYSVLIWFLIVYAVGAYIRKYPVHFGWRSVRYLSLAIVLYAALVCLFYVVDATGFSSEFWGINNYVDELHMEDSPFVLAISVLVFLAFRNMNVPQCRIINTIASAMFGVYLIHDMYLVRNYIYDRLFDCFGHTYSDWLLFYILMIAGTVLIVGTVIELIRIRVMDRWLLRWLPDAVESLHSRMDRKLEKFLERH